MTREHDMIRYAEGRTLLGTMFLATTARGICALRLVEGRNSAALLREVRADFPHAEFVQDDSGLKPLFGQVNDVLEGRLAATKIKLDMPGTPFQKEVWKELLRVRRGQVCSYSDLAARVKELTHSDSEIVFVPCLLYTSPSPRDGLLSRMPSSA